MDHVMSQAPGYERLKEWVSAPVLPTPAAFASILALVSKEMNLRILAFDVGGATTDVFTAHNGNVFRTVSANLGMSYSILNVAELGGLAAVRELVGTDISETDLWDHIGNKYINPTRLAASPEDMRMEWALASIAIREAARAHFTVMQSGAHEIGPDELDVSDLMRDPPQPSLPRESFRLPDCDLIIGSGGILSHSPRDAAAKVLVDALQPRDEAEVALDSTFMFPHLGVLAEVNPELARDLFFKLGIVKVGKVSDVRVHGLGQGIGYVPPPRVDEARADSPVTSGQIRLHRELAIPGEVLVKAGDRVAPDTLIARSTREFLRPYFLNVADALRSPPDEVPGHMLKHVGDEIEFYEAIASRPRHLLPPVTYHSPVTGRLEKLLPGGVVLVREKPEHAREVTVVDVAKELDVEPKRVGTWVRVAVGEEVEHDQWLAAIIKPGVMKLCKSPVRGRVSRIDLKLGQIRIEPLLEEKEVRAWLPGAVEEVSERGCIVAAGGTTIQGVWGSGGEAFGELRIDDFRPGCVAVTDFADETFLTRMQEQRIAGLIAGGVNLEGVLDPAPEFTTVVLEGFGRRTIRPEIMNLLLAHEGMLALVDGTTQLRVGVRRPVVVLPE
jgi:hypothetical protein